MRVRLVSAVLLGLGLLTAAPDLFALERLQRRFGVDEGLPFSEVASLAQDARGFLWIATTGGALFRYDGIEMRPWPPSGPRLYFTHWMAAGPDGEVLVSNDQWILLEVAGDEAQPLSGPDGGSPVVQYPPAFDTRGNLWIVSDGRLWLRFRGGAWRAIAPGSLASEAVTGVTAGPDGTVLALTSHGIWRLDDRVEADRIASVERVGKAILRADGSVAALLADGRVLEFREGSAREVYAGQARPIDIVERGDTLWLSYDSKHVILRAGETPETLGPAEDLPAGGPLLVDREGTLWAGTFWGLRQFPDPDTAAWGPADGLPGSRRLALTSEGIWVDSWGGLTLMRRERGVMRPMRIPGTGTSPLCVTPGGTLWAGYRRRFLERRGGRFIEHRRPDLRWAIDCAAGADGRIWLSSDIGLVLASPGSGGPVLRVVAAPPGIPPGGIADEVLEDSAGRLWVTFNDTVCRAQARAAAADRAAWTCNRLVEAGEIHGLAQLASGSVWAGTRNGVFRWDPEEDLWKSLPGSSHLPTSLVRRIRPSPSGGAWIVTFGTILRVAERPDSPDGWEIVERLSAWHGLMISDAEDILEETAGDLWITTLAGLVHIPPVVRRAAPIPPAVELVDVLRDGERLAWREGFELPWGRNRIELRFAALSYRDPSLLRYQVRLRPDAAWTDASGPPAFRFLDLSPGVYHAEVRASLDGNHWSEKAAGLSFTVLPPFWRTWWFLSVAALAAAGALYLLHRGRVARAVALERVRTHIATDLHDDVGASLSQIAILNEAALARLRRADGDAAPLLETAAQSARDLVDAMSDLVWAVDPRRDRLADLVLRMRRFAEGICAARGIALRFDAPEDAPRHLDASMRRNLYLVFKESVNNAVKHAGCSALTVELAHGRDSLELRVADDGRGFDTDRPAEGHGLESMRRRSGALGGSLRIDSRPGSGTEVRFTAPV